MTTHWTTTELGYARRVYEDRGCRAAARAVSRSMSAIYCAASRGGWRKCRVARDGSVARVALDMAAECGVTPMELSAETGKPLETVRPILSSLVARGRLVNIGGRRGMYVLPDEAMRDE